MVTLEARIMSCDSRRERPPFPMTFDDISKRDLSDIQPLRIRWDAVPVAAQNGVSSTGAMYNNALTASTPQSGPAWKAPRTLQRTNSVDVRAHRLNTSYTACPSTRLNGDAVSTTRVIRKPVRS
jgi:hypothetical protein